MRICVDAGHGGRDPGAVGEQPHRLKEEDVTLAVSLLLETELKSRGHGVLLTRRTDRTRQLSSRSQFANTHGADLFVSIHANSATDPRAEGIEVFHYEGSTGGNALAKSVLDELMATFPERRRRGVKTANFHVLRETAMPAILVELEFISNPAGLLFLEDPEHQRRMAQSIARGVDGVAVAGASPQVYSPEGFTEVVEGEVPVIDGTPAPVTIELANQPAVPLPSSGRFVGESHYVTTQDSFPGDEGYPSTQTQRIEEHLDRTLALYRRFDSEATEEGLYGVQPQHRMVWTPAEGGEIGQGSVGDAQLTELTPEMEMWFLTMMWRRGHRPPRGTKFLLSANGKHVVVVAGYETGPHDSQYLGGVSWEVHQWLGTDNAAAISIARLADQVVPVGPVRLAHAVRGAESGDTHVRSACEQHWDDHKSDCSGFVKAVARALEVSLTGNADSIFEQVQGLDWVEAVDGQAAAREAEAGKLVIAALKGNLHSPPRAHGHVAVVVGGELAHGKYPRAYWGSLGSIGKKDETLNWSWNRNDRDSVIYRATEV